MLCLLRWYMNEIPISHLQPGPSFTITMATQVDQSPTLASLPHNLEENGYQSTVSSVKDTEILDEPSLLTFRLRLTQ